MSRQPLDGVPPGNLDAWRRYGVYALLAVAGLLLLMHQTVAGMVSIWIRSETFAHGFLILPISAWLVWEKRRQLPLLAPHPEYRVLWLTVPLGFGWLLGRLVDVLVVQQLALVGLVILVAWTMLGTRVARFLAFPLGFLFFAVPMGEGLIPPMMDFTSDFTVAALRLTGIPVYREGTFFTIPSGNWSVVEGCSGVRYLIASVTLGVLYAYLTYSKLWKRLLFTLVSIVVPIFANGMRAYMIVMIAHLSDMKLALGVDHFIYGWVFFGIVVTIMFMIGAIFRDPPEAPPTPDPAHARDGGTAALKALLATLAVVAVWPVGAWVLEHEGAPPSGVVLQAPPAAGGWMPLAQVPWDWKPQVINTDAELYRFYGKNGHTVGLYLGLYLTQRQDAELVNSQNLMVRQKHPVWSNKGRAAVSVNLDGGSETVRQAKIVSDRQRLLTWHWYRVGGRHTANDYLAKFLEAGARLLGGRRDGAFLVVASPYQDREEEGASQLQDFLDAMLPGIEASLDRAAGRG